MNKKKLILLCLSLGLFSAYAYHSNLLAASNDGGSLIGGIVSMPSEIAGGIKSMVTMSGAQSAMEQARRVVFGFMIAYFIIITQLLIIIGLMFKGCRCMKQCKTNN